MDSPPQEQRHWDAQYYGKLLHVMDSSRMRVEILALIENDESSEHADRREGRVTYRRIHVVVVHTGAVVTCKNSASKYVANAQHDGHVADNLSRCPVGLIDTLDCQESNIRR